MSILERKGEYVGPLMRSTYERSEFQGKPLDPKLVEALQSIASCQSRYFDLLNTVKKKFGSRETQPYHIFSLQFKHEIQKIHEEFITATTSSEGGAIAFIGSVVEGILLLLNQEIKLLLPNVLETSKQSLRVPASMDSSPVPNEEDTLISPEQQEVALRFMQNLEALFEKQISILDLFLKNKWKRRLLFIQTLLFLGLQIGVGPFSRISEKTGNTEPTIPVDPLNSHAYIAGDREDETPIPPTTTLAFRSPVAVPSASGSIGAEEVQNSQSAESPHVSSWVPVVGSPEEDIQETKVVPINRVPDEGVESELSVENEEIVFPNEFPRGEAHVESPTVVTSSQETTALIAEAESQDVTKNYREALSTQNPTHNNEIFQSLLPSENSSLIVYDITRNELIVSINPELPLPVASAFKSAVALYYFDNLEDISILSLPIEYWQVSDESKIPEEYRELWKKNHNEAKRLFEMIVYSDNVATGIVMSHANTDPQRNDIEAFNAWLHTRMGVSQESGLSGWNEGVDFGKGVSDRDYGGRKLVHNGRSFDYNNFFTAQDLGVMYTWLLNQGDAVWYKTAVSLFSTTPTSRSLSTIDQIAQGVGGTSVDKPGRIGSEESPAGDIITGGGIITTDNGNYLISFLSVGSDINGMQASSLALIHLLKEQDQKPSEHSSKKLVEFLREPVLELPYVSQASSDDEDIVRSGCGVAASTMLLQTVDPTITLETTAKLLGIGFSYQGSNIKANRELLEQYGFQTRILLSRGQEYNEDRLIQSIKAALASGSVVWINGDAAPAFRNFNTTAHHTLIVGVTEDNQLIAQDGTYGSKILYTLGNGVDQGTIHPENIMIVTPPTKLTTISAEIFGHTAPPN